MALFGNNNKEAFGEVPFVEPPVEQHAYGAEQLEVRSIDMIGDNYVAVDQNGQQWYFDNNDPDPNMFKLVQAAHVEGDTYVAIANNGQQYPITHALFGKLTGLESQTDTSEHDANGFYERRTNPNEGSIEVRGSVTWTVQNPEDYELGRIYALVHSAGQGDLAKQLLQYCSPAALAQQTAFEQTQQAYYDHDLAAAQARERQLAAPQSANEYAYNEMAHDESGTTTLDEDLWGSREQESVDPSLQAPDLQHNEIIGSAHPSNAASKNKAPKSVRRWTRRGLLAIATMGICVPATHTVVHTVGNNMPFVKFDQNDPMTFSGDLTHNAQVSIKGLGEIVTVLSGGKVRL